MADAKIKISDEVLEDYKKTAIQWEPVLLDLPLRAAADVLKFFSPVPGLRGKKRFGAVSAQSQFAPFDKHRVSEATVKIDYREIETFHGNVVETFSPVDYIDLPMGYDDPILGDAIKNASTTALVLMKLAAARGQFIAQAAFTGKRNADGTTTADICDGLITIADKEIAAGTMTTAIGNLYEVTDEVTKANAVDIAKDIVFSMNPFLRRANNVMLVDQDFVDKYNEGYLLTHEGIVYNTKYDQPFVEGSNHKLTLIPVPELEGTKTAIITQRDNLLYGFDNKSRESFCDIMRTGHYELSFAQDIFLGFQFRTIDPRRLRIVKFKGKE